MSFLFLRVINSNILGHFQEMRMVNQVRVPAKSSDLHKDTGNTSIVDVESQPRRKTRKKSSSALAHNRARRKRYRKKKTALKDVLANVGSQPGTLERVKLSFQRSWIL